MEQEQKFLTTTEVARELDVSADSVRRYERDGTLSAIKIGKGQRLFDPLEVEKFRRSRKRN